MQYPVLREHLFSPLFALVLALLLGLGGGNAWAQALRSESSALRRPVRVIEISGPIAPSLLPKVRAALEVSDPDRFPAGALILLDSQGGDGLAALEIGRMLRGAKAHVFVRGRCASACVFVLAGGVVRGVAIDGSVAIHKSRLTTFVKGIGVVDISAGSNPRAAKALELADRQARDYLQEMGLPDELYTAMMRAPTDQPRYLSLAEAAALGVSGIDAGYRLERAPRAAAEYKVPEEEFVRRTLRAPEKCLVEKTTPRNFDRCYRRLLQTGE